MAETDPEVKEANPVLADAIAQARPAGHPDRHGPEDITSFYRGTWTKHTDGSPLRSVPYGNVT